MKEKTSDVIFTAKNIDSNTVADVIFDLPNQIEGTANATLHAETKDSFDKVKAYIAILYIATNLIFILVITVVNHPNTAISSAFIAITKISTIKNDKNADTE